MAADTQYDDQALENAIGLLLRVGVVLSAMIVLGGGILYLVQDHGARADYGAFRGVSSPLARSVAAILHGAMAGRGSSIIQLGLLSLIATPVARVLFAVAGFLRERDWMYSVISAIVLIILLYSLLFGR